MKLYVPGCESAARVALLLELTRIDSTELKAAIHDHLVHGWPVDIAAYRYQYDISNLQRGLTRVNKVIGIYNKLKDLK